MFLCGFSYQQFHIHIHKNISVTRAQQHLRCVIKLTVISFYRSITGLQIEYTQVSYMSEVATVQYIWLD